MTFEELLKQRRVALEPVGPDEISSLRALASRYIADAAIEEMSPEGRFQQAHGAARTLATMIVRASGCRVKQPGAHFSTFLALEAADSGIFLGYATYFDTCRTLRDELTYEGPAGISETELEEILRVVPEFLGAIEARIALNHPEFAP